MHQLENFIEEQDNRGQLKFVNIPQPERAAQKDPMEPHLPVHQGCFPWQVQV